MSRERWFRNLERLRAELAGIEESAEAVRMSERLPLAHSTSLRKFERICSGADARLLSAAQISSQRGVALDPNCAEARLETADCVFLYASPFRYPHTNCGVLFAPSIEDERREDSAATPFDSGWLVHSVEDPLTFFREHEIPVPEHRGYLAQRLDALFRSPGDYLLADSSLRKPGPIPLHTGDCRRWTHEVRIRNSVSLLSGHLLAVFVPQRAAMSASGIRALLEWVEAHPESGTQIVTFEAGRENEFEAMRNASLAFIRSALQ